MPWSQTDSPEPKETVPISRVGLERPAVVTLVGDDGEEADLRDLACDPAVDVPASGARCW